MDPRSLVSAVRHGRWPVDVTFYDHTTVAEARALLPTWDDLYKVSIVRNPWDYSVSRWFWQRERPGGNPDVTLDETLRTWDPAQNWHAITIHGELALDRVVRFESLVEGLNEALSEVGMPAVDELPRAKVSAGGKRPHYRDVLEPRHIEFIAERCATEIEHFGTRSRHDVLGEWVAPWAGGSARRFGR